MNNSRLTLLGIIAFVALIVLSQTIYIVGQTQQGLVIRFGEVVRTANVGTDDSPGLKIKMPFVETRLLFDKRNRGLEAAQREIIAGNQERLIVDAFVRYRIVAPVRFYTRLGDERRAPSLLNPLINASLRQVLGTANSEDIVSARRAELMQQIRDNLARRAATSKLGIEVIDVRIRSADLPQANQAAVFERMKTARQQEAARIRAEGQQLRREIIATATEEAETIRGQADAERAKIFASSYGRDPGFAAFYRSMQAYEASMAQGDTTMVLSPESDFFKYFSKGAGR
ncbi:MAG: protease modulator HflC [Caulobacter sp.]|nr:protease modulator HflC [Caulobacter sp.]